MLGAARHASARRRLPETGQSSYETILIGDELIGYARAFMQPLATGEMTEVLEEITAVGPGGSHLGRTYTRQHYRDFWQAGVCDQRIYDRWFEDGAKTMRQRAKERVAELRSEPRSFALDDAQVARLGELLAEVAERAAGRRPSPNVERRAGARTCGCPARRPQRRFRPVTGPTANRHRAGEYCAPGAREVVEDVVPLGALTPTR
jgi:hypothetical protein